MPARGTKQLGVVIKISFQSLWTLGRAHLSPLPRRSLLQPSHPVYCHWDLERINQELRIKDIMILVGKVVGYSVELWPPVAESDSLPSQTLPKATRPYACPYSGAEKSS